MIVRVVKMTFRHKEIENFKHVFEESKEKIRSFPGVLYLEMLQGSEESNVFFTYSHWENEKDLENYRKSALFKATWTRTKPLFLKPAKAWSTNRLHTLN